MSEEAILASQNAADCADYPSEGLVGRLAPSATGQLRHAANIKTQHRARLLELAIVVCHQGCNGAQAVDSRETTRIIAGQEAPATVHIMSSCDYER
jgi:hypothetical protein